MLSSLSSYKAPIIYSLAAGAALYCLQPETAFLKGITVLGAIAGTYALGKVAEKIKAKVMPHFKVFAFETAAKAWLMAARAERAKLSPDDLAKLNKMRDELPPINQ